MRRGLLLPGLIGLCACQGTAREAVHAARLEDPASIAEACRRSSRDPRYEDRAFHSKQSSGIALEARISAAAATDLDNPLAPALINVELTEISPRGSVHERRILVRRAGVIFTAASDLDPRALAPSLVRLRLFAHPEADHLQALLSHLNAQPPRTSPRRPLGCSGTRPGGGGDCAATLLLVPHAPSEGPDLLVIEARERFIGGALCAAPLRYVRALAPGPSLAAQVNAAFATPQRLEPTASPVYFDGW